MLKLFGLSREPEPTLPDDCLSPSCHLLRGRAVFQAQAGIPATADGLAYDPVQRLLAVSVLQQLQSSVPRSWAGVLNCCPVSCTTAQVSTADGRVKVLGQEGVEGLLVSSLHDPAPTQQLLFAHNRGGLVRLDQVGVVLWV